MREKYPYTRPAVIKAGPIFGLGYRPPWGLGNVCQARFAAQHGLTVMLAQQSAREIERTGRSFQEVVDSGTLSAWQAGLKIPWGADGDHLRNEKEVTAAAAAGCTHFTYDVTAELDKGLAAVVARIAAFFNLTREIKGAREFTVEVSLDEGATTTPVDYVVKLTQALKARGVAIHEIAPRFPGYFEKAIDYYSEMKNGRRLCDPREFEKYLVALAAAARQNNFRVCIHSGSDKFSIYPIVARILKNNFHLKTAGTYYLEDLKIIARRALPLFTEIYEFSRAQFEKDRATYDLSCEPAEIPALADLSGNEIARLLQSGRGNDHLRQVLHVTYGSVLTAPAAAGRPRFAAEMEAVLRRHAAEYEAELNAHLARHWKAFL